MQKTILVLLLFLSSFLSAQNEATKWYFGNNAGLDFATNPPTILTNCSVSTLEGCASIADALGNLLFYTDGATVFDRTHDTMLNGVGLLGDKSPCQSSIILKKPGNNSQFYVFTIRGVADSAGLNYSIIDMALAAGNGSVIAKNISLYNLPCVEKISVTRHCNGIDSWIIIHEFNSSSFRAYRLTPAGINTIAVISNIGIYIGGPINNVIGCIKLSPNGKKIGMTNFYTDNMNSFTGSVDLYDFDPSTGIISNWLSLQTGDPTYGCSFSPDGTKFYAGSFEGVIINQWDICAPSLAAITASHYTFTAYNPASMQLAPDGKIYVARIGIMLGVIQNPNAAGAACNYNDNGQSIAPGSTLRSLPNFDDSYLSPIAPFNYATGNTYGCTGAEFAAIYVPTQIIPGCSPTTFSLVSLSWNFGDPASGTSNNSLLSNPTHTFSSTGEYLVKLIVQISCGIDTISQPVQIAPAVNLSGNRVICKGEKIKISASGATTYSWSNGSWPVASITVSPTITTNYTVIGKNSAGCTNRKTFTIVVDECTGLEQFNTKEQAFKVYPNPCTGSLYIESVNNMDLIIMDFTGKTISTINIKQGTNTFDFSTLQNGIYFIKRTNSYASGLTRFVKTD